ncbi:hypothetical protein QYE76_001979 [Lolium multiflorum]|uniref:Uncharacterized protein n=1 Tax=Lolium multiflorum TaxID=4521 RepID=A0AAD8VZ42_LOLMU|nr:hypothetical protein QYE76_001979 [Lolium multiflorum]
MAMPAMSPTRRSPLSSLVARAGHRAPSLHLAALAPPSLATIEEKLDTGRRQRAQNALVMPTTSRMHMEPNEPINTKFYQLGNGGSLIFEHDLNAVSDFLGRPHPEFHGVQLDDTPGGELQWGEAIKLLNNDRKSLRQQRAKKDATIQRLRAKIASLEATVKAQEDQIRELEDDDGGIDLQGGGAFLSDDDDFEEDENTEEEDYEFLEAGPDDYVPIDVEDEE